MVDILSYLEEARAFAADAKGALLLYISDTLTAQYPALQALIDAVHPAAVIHTGDSVDEYKVGRLEADRIPYEAGMKELMEILGSADCPLYFTSGNNDDLNLIREKKTRYRCSQSYRYRGGGSTVLIGSLPHHRCG
ncbi:MAG: metallophosphoesterase [Clostridia bacterium]|nr:metallophosphoesterase [Clostridia bacterium]